MAVKFGFRMTEREYRANIDGLNIFFGAVLGFVLAGTETLDAWRFAFVLLLVAGTVVSILYVTASDRRLTYAIYTVLIVAVLPYIAGPVLGPGQALPAKIQPTLAVWTAATIMIEFLPRGRDDGADKARR